MTIDNTKSQYFIVTGNALDENPNQTLNGIFSPAVLKHAHEVAPKLLAKGRAHLSKDSQKLKP